MGDARHAEGQAFDESEHALGVVGGARLVLARVIGQLPTLPRELDEQAGDCRVEEAVEGVVCEGAAHEGVDNPQDFGPVVVGDKVE